MITKRLLTAITLAALSLPTASLTQDAKSPAVPDPRITLVPGTPAWNEYSTEKGNILDAVGIVQDELARKAHLHGSGVLFHRCYVLTSRHVIFSANETYSHKSVEFSASATGIATRPWKASRIAGLAHAWGQGNSRADDWAVVKLTKCLEANPTIPLGKMPADTLEERPLRALGYPNTHMNDQGKFDLKVHQDCRSLGSLENLGYSMSCSATDGQSGGPILARSAAGAWRVVGTIIGGKGNGILDPQTKDAFDGNRFTSVVPIWELIKKAISDP